ncbi:ATP-dependent helicase [Klebsiella variicola]|uniref:UvrD-helicase domain-containing protein n=1 Tax=Klebsiella variicola TaxID=244366 RepID=UPI00143E968F|nr:ATP-dependent helicase [Klebsiella variicola]QIX71547.1 ATP-dependent helicase [Klebsiella variicola]
MNELTLKGFLSDEQIKSVLHEGNAVVMACPGSGKTRTLSYKIAYELSKSKVNRFIIALTYTNSAADEIKKRIMELDVSIDNLWIGTLHSFCLKWIIKPYSALCDETRYGFKIIDPHDSEDLKLQLCSKYSRDYFKTDFGWCEYGLREKDKHGKEVVEKYYECLRDSGFVDFEQIVYLSYKVVSNNHFVAKNLSNIFEVVMVDEYQDTQVLQYELLFSLLKVKRNSCRLFFVGDPNQAIFNSMGGVALDFDLFSSRTGVKFDLLQLKDNYRSSQQIVDYFTNFRTVAGEAFEACGEFRNYKSSITFDNSCLMEDLDSNISKFIAGAIAEGISVNEICVIAPWWYHLSEITRRLMAIMPDVAFNGPGITPISHNRESLWYKFAKIALISPSPYNYRHRISTAGEIFEQLIDAGFFIDLKSCSPKLFLKHCNAVKVNEIGGVEYLSAFFEKACLYFDFDVLSSNEFTDSYDAFFSSAEKRKEKLISLNLAVLTSVEHYKRMFEREKGVTVTTIHSAKGLEFDCVIAFGLLDGVMNKFGEENDHSKRLLYVLSSRARKKLHLISEGDRRYSRGFYSVNKALGSVNYDYTAS